MSQPPRFALVAEHPPALSLTAGTAILIKTLCSHPSHPFCSMVATEHIGLNPVSGPWDTLPTLALFRPKSVFPNLQIGLGLLDGIAFHLQRHRVVHFFEKHAVERQLVIIANNARFTCFAAGIPSALPRDVYIIDDCVSDSHIYRVNKQKAQAAVDKLIMESERVFTISPVYAGDLEKKYGRACEFLPIPISETILQADREAGGVLNRNPFEKQNQKKQDTDSITIHHCGQIHHLYADALAHLVTVFKNIAGNTKQNKKKITLELFGNIDARAVKHTLGYDIHSQKEGDYFKIKIFSRVSREELLRSQQRADFLLLANSFLPQYENQVRCSLSSKITEYLVSRTPILVYGPAYSGLVNHLSHHRAAHVVSTPDRTSAQTQLEQILSGAGESETAEAARKLAHDYHSGEYFFSKLKNID